MHRHERQSESMKTAPLLIASLLLCTAATAAVPSSIDNDDSCDVRVGPAATLLLPYFEVDVNGTSGRTTLFTITNVTRYPQIVHVTLWTDWAYPVLTFNLFLTGYDVQAINLADVFVRGTIAPPSGTTSTTNPGALSSPSGGNLRIPLDCVGGAGVLPPSIAADLRRAFTQGIFTPSGARTCSTMGDTHANAIGYATIDVVAGCTDRIPLDPLYYTSDLLFDNVLIGDYQQIGANPAGAGLRSAFDAAGNPMVHIRAVPEGGGAGSNVPTGLPYTFYDRYTPSATRTIDRRQPLPSTFAARYIQGGISGFATNYTIWREGVTGTGATCAATINNSAIDIGEVVRFDEHENPFAFRRDSLCAPCAATLPTLPATSSTNTAGDAYPALGGTDVGGWLYLNLNNGGSPAYSITSHSTGFAASTPSVFGTPRASQNWVTVTMFGTAGSNPMTAELDAASLGNGCTPAAAIATSSFLANPPAPVNGAPPIGPAGGLFICPPGTTLTNGTTTLCTGTNVNPNP
jgi:hypothetical protein